MKDDISDQTLNSIASDENHRRMHTWRSSLQAFLRGSKGILKRRGATTLQYQCMLEIWAAPDQAGLTVGQAAKQLRVRHNTAVTVINGLCGKKLAVRVRSQEDRRVVHVQLTPLGRTLLAMLVDEHALELEKIATDMRKVIDQPPIY